MATALPTHPTLVHPITGRPLRAIFVSPKTGRVYWPILGGAPDDGGTGDGGQGGSGDGGNGGQGASGGADLGFPADTPLEQMKPEQREAYWKDKARKHEDRVKSLGNLTPEKLAELQEKAKRQDELELELGTTAEKAAAKARQEAEAEARATLQPQIIQGKLEAAAARAGVSDEDLAKAIEFVDTTKFLASDGSVDTDKVKAFVSTITPGRGNQQQKGPVVHGHGSGFQPNGSSAREKGKAEAERRFGKQSA